MSDLSIYIKQLRNQNHMRQTDFGKIVGVSGKAVWTWENDRSQPSFEQLCVLADHFGLDIDYFIHGEQKKRQEERIARYATLLDKLERLSQEDRWKLEGRIDTMLENSHVD